MRCRSAPTRDRAPSAGSHGASALVETYPAQIGTLSVVDALVVRIGTLLTLIRGLGYAGWCCPVVICIREKLMRLSMPFRTELRGHA